MNFNTRALNRNVKSVCDQTDSKFSRRVYVTDQTDSKFSWRVCVTRQTVNSQKDSDSSQNDDTRTMTDTHLHMWKHFSCYVLIPWDAGVVCGHPQVVFFCSQSQPPSFSSPKKRQNIELLKDIKLFTWQKQITSVQISVNKSVE